MIICDRQDCDINKPLIIPDVLMIASQEYTAIGRPKIPLAQVNTTCEQHVREEKGVSFKMKRRKSYHRKVGYRRDVTALRINDIIIPEELKKFFPSN